MFKTMLPFILLLIGTGTGIAAGMFLRPDRDQAADASNPQMTASSKVETEVGFDPENAAPSMEYVKLNNQFVVPIVKNQTVVALVVLSLSLEVPEGSKEAVFRMEPKLRDSFLQVLFDHANLGGFDGAFTSASNLGVLRTALREAGQRDMDVDTVQDVLILEIARQDY